MFIDTADIKVRAGKGGDGALSFRHEIYVDKGGPDGGDGGNGGNVVLVADRNVNTLLNFRHKQSFRASDGGSGAKRKRHGKNGASLFIKVPIGTIVRMEDGSQIADVVEDGQEVVVARGGRGGFGNAHFVSSVRRAPRIAEVGEDGDEKTLKLELKLLADVGLVGLPNAGKSTFLSVVSKARPEIADYPFTTLTPHLGVARIYDDTILIADIPGIIEGASEGKGLGDKFLRHIERTATLLHLIDIWSEDIVSDYKVIREELANYSNDLAERKSIVALTKIDGMTDSDIADKLQLMKNHLGNSRVFAISAIAGKNISELMEAIKRDVDHTRSVDAQNETKEESVPTISLPSKQLDKAWNVSTKANIYYVSGAKIEGFARRTNFDSSAGVARLRDIMYKMGILHELERRGINPGNKIVFGDTDASTNTARSLIY